MKKKYISESRYKKTTRDKVKLERKGITFEQVTKQQIKKIIVILISIMIIIALIVAGIILINNSNTKKKQKGLVRDENGVLRAENTSSIVLGVSEKSMVAPILSKNLYVSELNKYAYSYILRIDEEYNIKYQGVRNIKKLSNKEYVLEVNNKVTYDLQKSITAYDLKNSIEQIINLGDQTIYSGNFKNIQALSVLNESELKISLHEDDPLFIYKLEIPILPISRYNDLEKIKEDYAPQELGNVYNVYQNEDEYIYERASHASKANLAKINLKKYNDTDGLIEAFKQGNIQGFFTTRNNIQNDLGKYEYNIKQYATGQTVFMFGNPSHDNFKEREIRVALSYLINKVDIKKEIYSLQADSIDIPYLAYPSEYRYDKIAAENTLQGAGFDKIGGIYTKDKTVLTYRLLVNINNSELYQIAKLLKNNMAEVGIRIELLETDGYSFGTFLNSGNYDLALMEVNLNSSMDISFIDRYLYKDEAVYAAYKNVTDSTPEDLSKNFKEYLKVFQKEVPCIGVIARTGSMVYQKDIKGFDEIKYMNIFSNLPNICLTKK